MAIQDILEPGAGVSNSRSPIMYRYYLPEYDSEGYFLQELHIWSGSTGSKPSDSLRYSLKKYPDEFKGATFDVCDLLKQYLNKTEVDITSNPIINFAAETNFYSGGTVNYYGGMQNYRQSMLGYTNYSEGLNYIRSGEYFMSNYLPGTITVPDYNHFELTLKRGGPIGTVIMTGTQGGFGYTETINYIAYTGLTLATHLIPTINCGSYDLINEWHIDVDTNYPYYVKYYNGATELYSFEFITEKCHDTYKTFMYQNKWGAWEQLYFVGKTTTSNNIDFKTYKHNNLILGNQSINYNIQAGQESIIYKQGLDKMVVNTGWLDEVDNEKMLQFLLSEFVIDWDTNLPYIIENKEIKYKTDEYDKVINYELTLRAAFDKINSIR